MLKFLKPAVISCVIILTATIFHNVSSEKILSVAFCSSKSHLITYSALLEELARRGHEVTIPSPVKSSEGEAKKIRKIFTYDMEYLIEERMAYRLSDNRNDPDPSIVQILVEICRKSLSLPQVQELRKEKFDLIFVPVLLNECSLAYAHSFNTTVVVFSTTALPPHLSSLYGNPSPPSFVPSLTSLYGDRMTFYERTVNLLLEIGFRSFYSYTYTPYLEKVYRNGLNLHDFPSIEEIYKNTSLMLSNSHFSISHIRPFLPDTIEVGGMHCRPPNPLPQLLEKFVNGSGDGFILFSMGSALKSSKMSPEKQRMFLNAFSKVKQNILWKWEEETKAELLKNVKLSKWLPQQDLLGHPKIKAFITHGGFGSTTEAAYHGVPLIGIPMFADQGFNMETAERKGLAIKLDFKQLTSKRLTDAINEIVGNPKYKSNAQHVSDIFRDQPTKPLDRAVFWVEYAMRHKGAVHLRSSARALNFFQYHSIDVLALLGFLSFFILWLAYATLTFLARKIQVLAFRSTGSEKAISENKKK